MMEHVLFAEKLAYKNILYIGDNAKECIKIIEKFTARLRKIEKQYCDVLNVESGCPAADLHLQHHIQFHFEGGIAAFKFKDEDALPVVVRNECFVACQSLAFEQIIIASLPTFPLN
jgi:hypothetical protein